MRPIDGDALAAEVASWKRQQHSMNIDYSTGYRCALSVVEGMIAEAPAIDAIPVGWLKAQIVPYRDKLRDEAKGVFNATVREILYRWQKGTGGTQ